MATSSTRPLASFAWRAALKRFGLAILTTLAATLLFFIVGVPDQLAGAGGYGAGMTVSCAGSFLPDTSNHRLKNALLWAGLFILFSGGFLLVERWRGG